MDMKNNIEESTLFSIIAIFLYLTSILFLFLNTTHFCEIIYNVYLEVPEENDVHKKYLKKEI